MEAVPCMLRNADGTPGVYGLLIRPAPNQQAVLIQQNPSTSKNQSTLQLVPAHQQPIAPPPISGNKLLLPPVNATTTTASINRASVAEITPNWHEPIMSNYSQNVQPKPSKPGGNSVLIASQQQKHVPTTTGSMFQSQSPQAQVVPQMPQANSVYQTQLQTPVTRTYQPTYENNLQNNGNYPNMDKNSSGSNSLHDLTPLLDEIPQSDLVRLLVESESLLSPECSLLDGSVSIEASGTSTQSSSYPYQSYVQSSITSSQTMSGSQTLSQPQVPLNVQVPVTQPYHMQNQHFVPNTAPGLAMVSPRPSCRYQQERRWFHPAPAHPRPQLDWEQGPNESSGTPDSGVHSITGSPAALVHTPPLLSPSYQRIQQQAAINQQHLVSQISPTSTSSSARSSRASRSRHLCNYEMISDADEQPSTSTRPPDERPSSSSSSATKTIYDQPSPPKKKKKLKKRLPKNRRKEEYSDMPRLIPVVDKTVDTTDGEEQPEKPPLTPPPKMEVSAPISKIDSKFQEVCNEVLQQEKSLPESTVAVESTSTAIPQPILLAESTDPGFLVDKVMSSLKPDQLEQFTTLLQSKVKGQTESSEPVEKKVESVAVKLKKAKSRKKVESVANDRSDAVSEASTIPATLGEIPPEDFKTANVSEDPVLQDLSSSQKEKGNQTPKGPHTLSVREQNMLKKLKEYRRKARKLVDPKLLELILNLSNQLKGLCVSGQKKLFTDISKSPFQVDWEAINKSLEAKKTAYDNLNNLEKEAESGDEEVVAEPSIADETAKEEKEILTEEPFIEEEHSSNLVEITDNPQGKSISLKIKLSKIFKKSNAGTTKTSLPPKKRIKVVEPLDEPPILTEYPLCKPLKVVLGPRCDEKPKRKKRSIYPWDRKQKKSKSGPPVLVAEINFEQELQPEPTPVSVTPTSTPKKRKRKRLMNPWDRVSKKPKITSSSSFRRCRYCNAWIRLEEEERKDRVCRSCTDLPPNERKKMAAKKQVAAENKKCTLVIRKLPPRKETVVPREEVKTDEFGPEDYVTPRKKYLRAGLQWSSTSPDSHVRVLTKLDSTVEKCAELCGQDFLLPYDLWWEFKFLTQDQNRNPSTQYRKIRTNVYVNHPPLLEKESKCICKPEQDNTGLCCQDNCLNRMMYTECSTSCPCGELCANRNFQKHLWCNKLEKFDTNTERGFGVRTTDGLKAGTFLCEYVGEVVSSGRFSERMSTWYKNFKHHYALDLDSGFIIDSYRTGNIARFVNHSCQPNCQMQKWNVNGQYRMGIFAVRDLEAGEELTYDYRFHAFKDGQSCLCSSPKCRGTIKPQPSSNTPPSPSIPQLRALSYRERIFVSKYRPFLARNIDKLVRLAKKEESKLEKKCPNMASIVQAQLISLATERTVRTRRLTAASDNEKVLKLSCLAQILNHIHSSVTKSKDEKGERLLTRKKSYTDLKTVGDRVLSGNYDTPDQFDSEMKSAIESVGKSQGIELQSQLENGYITAKRNAVSQFTGIGLTLSPSFLQQQIEDPKTLNQVSKPKEDLLTTEANLSYLTEGIPVGSYNPDIELPDIWQKNANEGPNSEVDKVRCICGIYEEDGLMVQCDKCMYWLHNECVHETTPKDDNEQFICYYCINNTMVTPVKDIIQHPQPDVRFEGCTYYRTLTGPFQIRLGECVYVQRLIDDKQKALLRELNTKIVQKKGESQNGSIILSGINKMKNKVYSRKDLRIFRIERLFTDPNGQAFVFGCYYARPHETFCEPTRKFYRKEVFCTPLYDTLLMESVVARCLVLDISTFFRGRPRLPQYHEDDVYLSEYRLDKGQRLFDKISGKSRYPTNTEEYIFQDFQTRLKIKRDFTPFVMPKESKDSVLSESDDDLTPLGVIRDNLLTRKREQRKNRLENCVKKTWNLG